MKDQLITWLLDTFSFFPPELIVIIVAAFPILELRGSIPVAMGLYEMSFIKAFVLSVFGNMLPVLPTILLFNQLNKWALRVSLYRRLSEWMEKRIMKKGDKIQKYGAVGLVLFTAVPLPTTGAWSASVAASLFNIRASYGFLSIFLGVFIAGLIMGGFSFMVFG